MRDEHSDAERDGADARPAVARWTWRRTLVLLALLVAVAGTYAALREQITLANLARHEEALREWGQRHPLWSYVIAFVLYALVTGILPSATVFSLLYAWFFGFWRGIVLVSFASTSGATLAFLISRYLFRDVLRGRYGRRLERINAALEQEGTWYLFALRLTPVVPFFVVNAIMGLTPMRTRTFWWVSQLGMLPGPAVYVYAGATAPSLRVLADRGMEGIPVVQLLAALCLLGCFPVVARAVVRRLRGRSLQGE
jgi:uncharacterized membrane protein YdjX (TVP38/TMEM64 family)